MQGIDKQDILEAFAKKKRGRFNLLYLYYKDHYFHKGLPAEVMAQKISQDLDLAITSANIYEIHRRFAHSVSAFEEMKQEIKQDILHTLQQGIASPPLQQTTNPSSLPSANEHSFIIDPAFSMDQLEAFLRDTSLPIDQLEQARQQETSPGKKIIIAEKIRQLKHVSDYKDNLPKKSIFD